MHVTSCDERLQRAECISVHWSLSLLSPLALYDVPTPSSAVQPLHPHLIKQLSDKQEPKHNYCTDFPKPYVAKMLPLLILFHSTQRRGYVLPITAYN